MVGKEPTEPMRFSVAMWDFSWLTRRSVTEDEYRDWEAILSGLSQRGYTCVRIDAFPHLVSEVAEGRSPDRYRLLPRRERFPWGNHALVEVEPLRSLLAFVEIAKRCGLRVGLSSWFVDDTEHRRNGLETPEDLIRVWTGTLGVLAGAGLLDRVAWVDLCNEFPLGEWLPGAYARLFGRRWPDIIPLVRPWDRERREAVEAFYKTCIPALKRSYPELRYTFSMQRVGFGNLGRCDVSDFDLAEVHVWLAETVPFSLLSGHLPGLLCLPGGLALHRSLAPGVYGFGRDRWIKRLLRQMDDWASWARDRGLPLFTTEGWGPINYSDAPNSTDHTEWWWVKDVCAEAVRAAIDREWTGICTSNFCQPHFPGMWEDMAWHQEITGLISGRDASSGRLDERFATWCSRTPSKR